jgi:Mce-associated membrane protein
VHPDSAVVLVFVNKVTSSKQQPNPTMTPASVRVTLTKVNRSWLISEFDPL